MVAAIAQTTIGVGVFPLGSPPQGRLADHLTGAIQRTVEEEGGGLEELALRETLTILTVRVEVLALIVHLYAQLNDGKSIIRFP